MKGIIKKIEIQDCKDRYGASNRISGDQIGKSLICQEGKSVTSRWGLAVLFRFSSNQNPRLGLESLKRFPTSPRTLLPELKRNKATVRCRNAWFTDIFNLKRDKIEIAF